ncbi:MAG: DUF3880 domain-containing protein [Lachnospiraceae bacterium]|nr:DUF3880 domain-containing protein [Lachnospiraceae bacterium]
MKILLYDMGAYTQNDITDTLAKMGIEYKNVLYRLCNVTQDAYFTKRMTELLHSDRYDAVFSVNYYPVLADICHTLQILYLSWSYDSPLDYAAMEETLGYETNYVFLFDGAECRKLQKKGYTNVFHLPLAVNTERLAGIISTEKEQEKYETDISMVGQLYESTLSTLMLPLSEYDKGYLTAIAETQLQLYGCYYLEEVITKELTARMNTAYRNMGQNNLTLTRQGLINAVAKHITNAERVLLLDILSEQYRVTLYGPDRNQNLPRVNWRGSAGYFDEMPQIFRCSKINLNISLKCIQSGIPLRALDIMGCGGFLLTNYQQEIAESFVDGEEVVMYTSIADAVAKCRYYMEHDEERRIIAQNGYKKVKALFGFEDRLRTMFQTAGLLL